MDYEFNTIAPVVGVIIGWVLNELSQLFKSRGEDRRLINRTLFSLLDLLLILNHKKSLMKSALKSDKIEGINLEILCSLFNDKKFSSDEFKNTLHQTINKLAEIDPILCQGLSINAESIDIFKNIDESESLDRMGIEEKYKALEFFTKHLEFLIKKLLTKHSIFMRLRYEIYKRKNSKEDLALWDSLFQCLK